MNACSLAGIALDTFTWIDHLILFSYYLHGIFLIVLDLRRLVLKWIFFSRSCRVMAELKCESASSKSNPESFHLHHVWHCWPIRVDSSLLWGMSSTFRMFNSISGLSHEMLAASPPPCVTTKMSPDVLKYSLRDKILLVKNYWSILAIFNQCAA